VKTVSASGHAEEKHTRGLRNKIGTAFILQASAISCATLLGIYASATILEHVLIRRALNEEANHFAQLLAKNPNADGPDTHNMRGYLLKNGVSASTLPAELRALKTGFQTVRFATGANPLVYVKQGPYGRMILVFDQQNVGKLALLFGFVPMVMVLLFIYLASFATYRLSKRAISPVIWLANQVANWDAKAPEVARLSPGRMPTDLDGESQILAEALHGYGERIAELVERERTFTRDASHELRSPLSVIKMAAEVLLSEGENDEFATRNLKRIDAAVRDMEALIEAFLLLARDSASGLPEEVFFVNQLIREEIERAEPILQKKDVQLELVEKNQLKLVAPTRVAAVMIGNLIRNACRYTDAGCVQISVDGIEVTIRDTGRGMSRNDLDHIFQPFFRAEHAPRGGHGVGLTIVRRLSDRFRWPVNISSELGVGTEARIRFPAAEIVALEPSSSAERDRAANAPSSSAERDRATNAPSSSAEDDKVANTPAIGALPKTATGSR
jgi:signal transduction histidine kinase